MPGQCIVLSAGTDVTDADADVSDVKDPKTFYSVGGPRKTGTMPTQTLNPANDTVDAGYYEATTLSAVDADLTEENIKDGVDIFGKVGTYQPTLIPEAQSVNKGATNPAATATTVFKDANVSIAGLGDLDNFVTKTDTFGAISMAVAGFGAVLWTDRNDCLKVRLFMNGVQVAESAYLYNTYSWRTLTGSQALSGSKIVKVTVHNYDASACKIYWVCYGTTNTFNQVFLGIGSVRI